jgi:multimeric flavodoxin WrbA
MPAKSKNLLILLGSPREDGNTTRLAFAFADAACAKGWTVQSIRVPALEINACTACGECNRNRFFCALRDDMDSVYPLLLKADAILFATPLHFSSFSSSLKLLVDRLLPIVPGNRKNLAGKTVFLVSACGNPAAAAFRPLKAAFADIAAFMQWKTAGALCLPGLDAPDALASDPAPLAKAAALAAKLP